MISTGYKEMYCENEEINESTGRKFAGRLQLQGTQRYRVVGKW